MQTHHAYRFLLAVDWDCYNSFINLDHPLPKSPESRETVAQCSQSIDTVTRDQAIGHIDLLARTGVLSWGPAQRWTYQESQAADEVVRQVKECMGKQRWIYCCKGRSCELSFSGASPGKWFCRRRPVDTPSFKESNLDVFSWLQGDLQSPEIDFRSSPNFGQSEARAGLPLVTLSGLGAASRCHQTNFEHDGEFLGSLLVLSSIASCDKIGDNQEESFGQSWMNFRIGIRSQHRPDFPSEQSIPLWTVCIVPDLWARPAGGVLVAASVTGIG